MTKLLSYFISGQGITPDKTTAIINLLRDVGVTFSPSSANGHSGKPLSKIYFFPVEEVSESAKAEIIKRLVAAGIKHAHLERCGHYVRQ